jgi:hypothetical protein
MVESAVGARKIKTWFIYGYDKDLDQKSGIPNAT